MAATAKYGIVTPDGGVGNDIAAHTKATADTIDSIIATAFGGNAAARGAAGKFGRLWRSSDTLEIDFDTGAGWDRLARYADLPSTAAFMSKTGDTPTGVYTYTTGAVEIRRPYVTGAVEQAQAVVANAGGTITANTTLYAMVSIALQSNISLAFTWDAIVRGATIFQGILVELAQDATGGRTVTFPAAVKWPGGSAPTLSPASKTDVFMFTTKDAGTNIRGYIAGQAY